ncbi:hypothetical protein TWF281_004034 [Arthrobotrys megalospora]
MAKRARNTTIRRRPTLAKLQRTFSAWASNNNNHEEAEEKEEEEEREVITTLHSDPSSETLADDGDTTLVQEAEVAEKKNKKDIDREVDGDGGQHIGIDTTSEVEEDVGEVEEEKGFDNLEPWVGLKDADGDISIDDCESSIDDPDYSRARYSYCEPRKFTWRREGDSEEEYEENKVEEKSRFKRFGSYITSKVRSILQFTTKRKYKKRQREQEEVEEREVEEREVEVITTDTDEEDLDLQPLPPRPTKRQKIEEKCTQTHGTEDKGTQTPRLSKPKVYTSILGVTDNDDDNMRADADDVERYELNGYPDLSIAEHFFRVPLDYSKPNGYEITIFARVVKKFEKSVKPGKKKTKKEDDGEGEEPEDRAYLCYLNGGPGFNNTTPKADYVSKFIDKGYTIVLLDQRGTGLSECICPENIPGNTPEEQADYVSHFRADNIVRDAEVVREKLVGKDGKWSLAGQSFGGFCIATYLSFAPEHVVEAFMFGGIPPVGENTPDQIYTNLYKRLAERNTAYYAKYPKDIERVKEIAKYLSENVVKLPNGGTLTLDRFRDLGISFGMHGGIDSIHKLVFRTHNDITRFRKILSPTLSLIQSNQSFDDQVLYCILHEAIYCQDGNASNWSADRILLQQTDNRLRSYDTYITSSTHSLPGTLGALFFTGEMIYPSMLSSYASLSSLKPVAELLAAKKWEGKLYDLDQLAQNKVPVYAASYLEDMYVDYGLARVFVRRTKGVKEWVSNGCMHNAISARSGEVIGKLWELRKGVTD